MLISPKAAMPPGLTVAEAFAAGPLLIVVNRVDRSHVSLGIEAPQWLYIERAERGNF